MPSWTRSGERLVWTSSSVPGRDGREPAARPRILVLNQYYWPGIEATAQLLASSARLLRSTTT